MTFSDKIVGVSETTSAASPDRWDMFDEGVVRAVRAAVAQQVRRGANAGPHMDPEDIVQEVLVFLIKKTDTPSYAEFVAQSDPDRSMRWASAIINSAISDVLRAYDPLTRTKRQVVNQARQTEETLVASKRRRVTSDEVAEVLQIKPSKLRAALADDARTGVSIDSLYEDQFFATPSVEDEYLALESWAAVKDMLRESFSVRDQQIISAVLEGKESNAAIAVTFGVDRSRVTQIMTRYRTKAASIVLTH